MVAGRRGEQRRAMGGGRGALVLLVAYLACPPPARGAEAEGGDLGERTRAILEPRCGKCHNHTAAHPKPRALRVFDLAEPDWSRRMTVRQLPVILDRLKFHDLPDEERAAVGAFVASEKQRRGHR